MERKGILKKGIYNTISSFAGTVIAVLIGLIVPRLVLVNYGSETNGMVNSINQFVAYLSLFEAGISVTAKQALYSPVAKAEHGTISSIMSALNLDYKKIGTLYLIFLLLLSFIYPSIVITDDSTFTYMQVFFCMLFSGLGNVILFFVQGKYRILLEVEGKKYILSNLQTVITVLVSIAKIILLLRGCNIVSVIISTFILNLIQVGYILGLIKRKYKWLDVNLKTKKKVIKQTKYAFIHQVCWLVFLNIDVVLLTVFCDLKVVSVYSMYKLVVNNVQTLLNIPFDSFSFGLGQLCNTDRKQFKKANDCVEIVFASFTCAVLSVTYFLLTPFISMYTKGVTDIVYVDRFLPTLFVVIELLTAMRKPMMNIISYAGHFRETLSRRILETVMNLVFSIVGVYLWGIYGVLIGTVVSLMYRNVDAAVYANNKILNRSSVKTFSIYILNYTVLFIEQVILHGIHIIIDNYLTFMVVAFILLFVFTIIHISINMFVYKQERKMILQYINDKFKRRGVV